MWRAQNNKRYEPSGKDCLESAVFKTEKDSCRQVDDAQHGFMKELATRNTTLVLRTVMKRAMVKQKDVYMSKSKSIVYLSESHIIQLD